MNGRSAAYSGHLKADEQTSAEDPPITDAK
jgi:hypothetical protein